MTFEIILTVCQYIRRQKNYSKISLQEKRIKREKFQLNILDGIIRLNFSYTA